MSEIIVFHDARVEEINNLQEEDCEIDVECLSSGSGMIALKVHNSPPELPNSNTPLFEVLLMRVNMLICVSTFSPSMLSRPVNPLQSMT